MFRKSLSLMVALSSIMSVAFAAETPMEVSLSLAQKDAVVAHMRETIERHKTMTAAEIAADIREGLERNREALRTRGSDTVAFDRAAELLLDKVKDAGSESDTIIAMESAQLQEWMSSSNLLLFAFTRGAYDYAIGLAPDSVWPTYVFLAIFTVPLDIVCLPIQWIAGSLAFGR